LNTDGTIGWAFNTDAGPVTSGTGTVVLNVWNLIEFNQIRDASVGGMEAYLNNALQFTDFATDTTLATSATSMKFRFGPYNFSQNNGGDITVVYDDMAIGTGGYIGPGSVLAFQGKAGTPTHDTWTKSNGSDAYALWSDTPYIDTDNCNSAVSGDKQSMLIEELIGVSVDDTINGCFICSIGVVNTGSSTIKLLHRINATDTLSAAGIFIGNTNPIFLPGAVFESCGVFTATKAELEAGEIGAECEDSAKTTILYDVWLMVDYTAAAVETVSRMEKMPYDFDGASLSLGMVLPYEVMSDVGKVQAFAEMPTDWDGEDPFLIIFTWNNLILLHQNIDVTWAVFNDSLRQSLLVNWRTERRLPMLGLQWNIFEPMLLFDTDIQLPAASGEKTP